MSKKEITISIETAREMYNSEIDSLKKLALDNFDKEELENEYLSGFYTNVSSDIKEAENVVRSEYNINVFATKEQAEASLALAQLSHLIKQVNGDWEPKWSTAKSIYSISFFRGTLEIFNSLRVRFLAFKTRKEAKEFIEKYRDLITKAKPLL